MSGSSLPENPADWPGDPYAVLGVARSAEWKEIRRAYAARIKIYKPEQAPEAFQKIRAAYELLQRFQDREVSFAPLITPIESPPPPTREATSTPEEVPEHRQPDHQPPPDNQRNHERPLRPVIDPPAQQASWYGRLQEVQLQIQRGEVRAAYQELTQLELEKPGDAEVCLALFWLLRLRPDLLPERNPLQWLLKSLRQYPHQGPVWEVCQQEFQLDPQGALLPDVWAIIERFPGGELSDQLLRFRVQALATAGDWQTLSREIDALHDLLLLSGTGSWESLLFQVINLSIWDDSQPAILVFAKCHQLLSGNLGLGVKYAYQFQRLDVLMEARTSLRKLESSLSPGWMRLLQASWQPERQEFREIVQQVCWNWYDRQSETYAILCQLFQECPLAAAQLAQSLTNTFAYRIWVTEPRMKWLLARVHDQFRLPNNSREWTKLRGELLEFCVREQVPLGILLEGMATTSTAHYLQQELRDEHPLNVQILGILASRLPDLDE